MSRSRLPILVVGAAWLAFCIVTVTYEVAFPGPDVFQFKGPGVYFAQHGLLGGINLPFAPPNVPVVYAFYPPVYPFLFGLWCKVLGVSLQASTAFELTVRTLRAVMLLGVIWPTLRKSDTAGRWFVATTLLLLSLVPNNEDRPDELGLIFGLGSWLVLWRGGHAGLAGILLGLCGATSPAAGLFSALGVPFVCRTRTDVRKSTVMTAALSVVTALATVVPIVMSDPSAIGRFMTGVHFNALPYNRFGSPGLPDGAGILTFLQLNMVRLKGGTALFPLLLALAGLTVWLWRTSDAAARRTVFPAVAAATAFLPITLTVFPKEPIYPWFTCIGLIIAVLGLTLHRGRYRVVQLTIMCGMALFIGREGKMLYDALHRPANQTLEAAQATLLSEVEPTARIAGWPDTMFTLAGVRPLESLEFSCQTLDTYDYVFLTEGTTFPRTASQARAPELAQSCGHPAVSCFTVRDDFRSREPVTVFGWQTGLRVRGFGGVLFKRTGC